MAERGRPEKVIIDRDIQCRPFCMGIVMINLMNRMVLRQPSFNGG